MSKPISRDIEKEWIEFRNQVIPANAGAVQLQEMRRTFYAGVWSGLNLMLKVSSEDVSEDQGAKNLESLRQECIRFNRQIQEGRA